jgi:hypothetical protein
VVAWFLEILEILEAVLETKTFGHIEKLNYSSSRLM